MEQELHNVPAGYIPYLKLFLVGILVVLVWHLVTLKERRRKFFDPYREDYDVKAVAELTGEPRLVKLRQAGYVMEDGKTVCWLCGGYCGQCGGDRSGLTLDEYEAAYGPLT